MKNIIILTLLAIFFQSQALCSEKLTVLTEDWPPFNFEENGKIVGISTDLVIATLQRAGVAYILELKPWKRVYHQTLETPYTLLFTTSRTEIREQQFKWVGPLYPRQIILYKLKSRPDIHATHLNDLKKYKVGVLRGGSVEEYLNSKGIKNLESVTRELQNILKLFKQRVDLIPGSDISMAYRMKETPYKLSDLDKAFVLIDQGGYYIAINRKTPDEVVTRLQIAFDALIAEGLRQKVTQKYLGY